MGNRFTSPIDHPINPLKAIGSSIVRIWYFTWLIWHFRHQQLYFGLMGWILAQGKDFLVVAFVHDIDMVKYFQIVGNDHPATLLANVDSIFGSYGNTSFIRHFSDMIIARTC